MYDVIFIGSGHAAWHAVVTMALAGKKVAVVEKDLPGGACPNYGCDAKILLDGPFEYLESLERYKGLCIDQTGSIDWKKLMNYKKEVIGVFPNALIDVSAQMGITFIKASGKILDAHTVQAGEQTIEGEAIVIATGQRDAQLNILGSKYVRNSRDFLSIEELPEHLICIGAGVISMEFASMALTVGKKVTFIEFAPRALSAYPEKYVEKLVAKMKEQGAEFYFNEAVTAVEKTDNCYKVVTKSGLTVCGDYVLGATGRVANYEDLGLEELGIQASRRGITVDDHLRTSVPSIYASGDVIDKSIPRLTPTAEFESNYLASLLLGETDAPICYPNIPNLVFTLPRIAQVGISVAEAGKDNDKYRIVDVPYGAQNEWIDNRETDIELTYIFDKDNYLVGAAIYGSEAGTWIDFITLIINKKITAADLKSMIFAFPTNTYMLVNSLLPHLKK